MALTKLNFSGSGQGALAASGMPSGSVIQTQKTVITSTDTITMTANTVVDMTGLSVNLTPQFSNSIIYLTGQVFGETSTNGPHNVTFMFRRDSTDLKGTVAGSRNVGILTPFMSFYNTDHASTPESVFYAYHDEPISTSQITYKIAVRSGIGGGGVWHLNKTVTDSDGGAYERGMSFIMAQEIKA